MEKRSKVEDILERAAEAFDLPADIVAGMSRIEILGDRELRMENHKGILHYGTEEIDVGGSRMVIKIKGKGLNLRAMNARELLITGQILNIEFVY